MTKFKNIAAAFVSLVIFTTAANAQVSSQAVQTTNTPEPFSIKYLGNDGDYLLFRLSMQPVQSSKGKFNISDREVGSLYSANLPKTFKETTLKIEKRDDQELNFQLVIGSNVYSKSFSVNTNLVEHTTVSESDVTSL